jgi:hypothetical protein
MQTRRAFFFAAEEHRPQEKHRRTQTTEQTSHRRTQKNTGLQKNTGPEDEADEHWRPQAPQEPADAQ